MKYCRDALCEEATHSNARDKVILNVLLAMVECSYTSLPLTGKVGSREGTREVIPGWNTEVEPHRKETNTCYRTWLAAGKQRQAKVQSNTRFRYAVRKVKRAKKLHQARGLYGAAMAGDIELMKELRRVKTGKGQIWMGWLKRWIVSQGNVLWLTSLPLCTARSITAQAARRKWWC